MVVKISLYTHASNLICLCFLGILLTDGEISVCEVKRHLFGTFFVGGLMENFFVFFKELYVTI